MARISNKKIIKSTFLVLFCTSINAYAIDPLVVIKDIVNSKAGGKFNDEHGGKEVEQFLNPNQCKRHYPWGEPRLKDEAVVDRTLYLCREKFSIQYDPKLKLPLNTTEILLTNPMVTTKTIHPAKYQPDDQLPEKIQANPKDFLNTGYVPIQLASFYNLDIATLRMDERYAQGYFNFSNTVPMVGNNLANTIWADLEHQIRVWSRKKDKLYITTGIIYLHGQTNGVLPHSKTLIPTHFYKIITHPQNHGTVSFIIPNKEIYTYRTKEINNPKNLFKCNNGPCTLSNFIVPIQEVERLTNTEFYPLLAPHYAVKVKLDANEMFKNEKRSLE